MTARAYRQGMELDREAGIPLSVQLANLLRNAIETGDIPPGRAIPSKRTLRETYGIASSTVDKAMGILKSENMIAPVRGMGLYVTGPRDR
jgi:GntR family transcriptional regulator